MSNNNLNNLYQKFSTARGKASLIFPSASLNNFSKINLSFLRNIKKSYYLYASVVAIVALAFFAGRGTISNNSGSNSSNEKVEAPAALATQTLNKTFQFPLKDEKGKEVAKISYLVTNANLQDAFIYQGKLAKAVKGRTFLIFDLKITNPYTKTIEINAKDYIRVKVNGSSEQLAPEIHNDPVQIQANSTKYTRVGLPINDTDKNIILLIGELQGEKETVALNLKK